MNARDLLIWAAIILVPFFLGYGSKNSVHMIEFAKKPPIPIVFVFFPLFGSIAGIIEVFMSSSKMEQKTIAECIFHPLIFWSFAVGTCFWAAKVNVAVFNAVSTFFLVGAASISLNCFAKKVTSKYKYGSQ